MLRAVVLNTPLYCGTALAAAALAIALAVFAYRRSDARGNRPFALLMLAAAEWALTAALEAAAPARAWSIFFTQMQYIGVTTLGPLWLLFACEYSQRTRWLTLPRLVALWTLPALSFLLVLTQSQHGAVWREILPLDETPDSPLVYVPGPVEWFVTAYSYAMILGGTLLLLANARRTPALFRRQTAGLLGALLLPWASSVAYMAGINPFPAYDPTPIAFVATGLIVAWTIFRWRLLDVVPVAHHALFAGMQEGVVVLDPQGRVADCNPAARRMLGSPPDETGRLFEEILASAPDLVVTARDAAGLPQLARLGLPGAERDLEIQVSPLSADPGRASGRLVMLRDVTDRRRAQAQQAQLAQAIEQSAEITIITDPDGRIQYVNPAFERITGYPRAEAIGQTPRLLKSGRHSPAFYEDLWSTISGGRTWQGALTNRRKDGTLYQEEATIAPMFDETGRLVRYVAQKRDVTRERALEEQLRQSQKLESIGRLAGGVAHDFNNLLQVLLGATELGQEKAARGEACLGELEEIHAAGWRAAGLVRQLLAFSRRQVLQPRRLDLNEHLAALLRTLRRILGEPIVVHFDPGAGVPAVEADLVQIEQVILNLCINARDAMPGGGQLRLDTAAASFDEDFCRRHTWAAPGSYAMIRIADNGPGIPPESREHIFEPFFTTKGPSKGSGLGLATVYGIVQQHHGLIQFETQPGEGTVFRIYLPAAAEGTPAAEGAPAPAPAAPAAPRGHETLLVAEDDPDVRRHLARSLAEAGYSVLEAADGAEALDLLETRAADIRLALLDVVMPRAGGRQVYEAIRVRHPHIRTLFSSGYGTDEIAEAIAMDGNLPLINKPYESSDLLRRVREILDE